MDSLRMTTHGVKAPETVKGEYVSRVIPNYVQKKIDRGFERLYVTDLARELRSDYLYRTARQNPPESVAEVVELIQARSSLNLVYPHHFRPYIEALESIPEKQLRLVFHAPPQHGKAVHSDTPMFTGRGWVKASEVVVGDKLVGSNGEWTSVTGVFPQGEKQLYKVTFNDGSSLKVCGEHLWNVRGRYYPNKWYTKPTEEIAGHLTESDGRSRYQIPMMTPGGEYNDDLPIDPYLLGAWLGDGTTTTGVITTMDDEIVEAFAEHYRVEVRREAGKASMYQVWGLSQKLKELGVRGNKHIPDEYFNASVEQRLALFQGLMDTDGTANRIHGVPSFCTVDSTLARDFRRLVGSLGGTVREYIKGTYESRGRHRTIYILSPRLPEGLDTYFRLERKQALATKTNSRSRPRRFIKSIEPVEVGEAVCFSVDAEDKLFCAGDDFIVTHNTQTTLISLAYLALTRKNFVSAYCTYNSFRALSAMNDDFVPLLVALGVDFFVKNNVVHIKGLGDRRDRISTNKILFTSRGSSLTGFSFNGVIVIDDIIKNEEEAMSPAIQEKVWSWYTREVLTRESKHLSIITMMTRWSNSDLAGKILKDRGEEAEYIRIPAIADDENDPLGREIGAPLWPEEGRDLAFLERKRAEVGERAWFAMYQGTPSSEDKLFDPTSWVDTMPPLPPNRTITVYGIDLAYSAKRRSDYSVIVKVVVDKLNGVAYLVDAHRRQCLYTDFIRDIQSFVNEPGSIHWHAGSMEEHTVGAQLRRELPGMRIHKAVKSKVVRAKDTVKHWNAGRILVLNKGNLRTVAPVIELFDGVEGHEDDVVDALVSAIEPVKAFLEARPERVTKVDNSARLQRIEDRGLRRGGLRRNTGSLRKRML